MADSFLLSTGSLPSYHQSSLWEGQEQRSHSPLGHLIQLLTREAGFSGSLRARPRFLGLHQERPSQGPCQSRSEPGQSPWPFPDSLESALFRAEVVLFPGLDQRRYPWSSEWRQPVNYLSGALHTFFFFFNYKLKKCYMIKIIIRRMSAHISAIRDYFEGE